MTEQRAFMNRLRSLWNIDHDRLPEFTQAQWAKFRDGPHRFLAEADDPTAAAIWRAIEERQPQNKDRQP